MKKIAFGALALATVIGLSVMSPLTTAAAEAEIAREAEILRAIDEKNQYIGDLLTEQSHAYLRGDIKTAENIESELAILGVEDLSQKEISDFSNQVIPASTSDDDYDGVITETTNNKFHRYIVDSGMYSAQITIATPITTESNLYKAGTIVEHEPDYLKAGMELIGFASKAYLGSVYKTFDFVFTFMDAFETFGDIYEFVTPNTYFDCSGNTYKWSSAEMVCFLGMPSPNTNTFFTHCVSNQVEINVSAISTILNVDGMHSESDDIHYESHYTYISPLYCNTYEYFQYRKTGILTYDGEEMLKSYDIYGVNGNLIHTVELTNPKEINVIW